MQAPRRQLRDRVGTTLAEKYRLQRLLGVGGMAAVYEAENTWTGRRVAIKLLKAGADAESDVHQRFMQEARSAAKVEHPNIVQVLDLGRDGTDGTFFIVQEFLTGHDLRAVLDERGALPPRAALEITVPLAAALASAHRQGIIHRDIKPANIFLARSATGEVMPKLLDFGIAKVLDPGSTANDITRAGTTMGTPEYMSPEQANGDRSLGPQTDVWSMGVVLYEMLAGRCPFENVNYHALLAQIIWTAIPRLDDAVPTVPRALADIVHRALERDRAKRYPSMREFLDALLGCEPFLAEPWHKALVITHGAPPSLQSSHSLEHIVMRAPAGPRGELPTIEEPTTEIHHDDLLSVTSAALPAAADFDGEVPTTPQGQAPGGSVTASLATTDARRRTRWVLAALALALVAGASAAITLHLRAQPGALPPAAPPAHTAPVVVPAAPSVVPPAPAPAPAVVAPVAAPPPATDTPPDGVMQFDPDDVGALGTSSGGSPSHHHGTHHHHHDVAPAPGGSSPHHHGGTDAHPAAASTHAAPATHAGGTHGSPHGAARPANGSPILRVD